MLNIIQKILFGSAIMSSAWISQGQLTLSVVDQVYSPGENLTVDVLLVNSGSESVFLGGAQTFFGLTSGSGGATGATFSAVSFKGVDAGSATIWQDVFLFDGSSTSGSVNGLGTSNVDFSFEALGSENVLDFASVEVGAGESKVFARLTLNTSAFDPQGEIFMLDLSRTTLSDGLASPLSVSSQGATFTPVPEPEDAVMFAGLVCLAWVGFHRWRNGTATAAALTAMALGLGFSDAHADTAVVDAGAHISRLEDGKVTVSIRVSGPVTIYGMNLRLKAEGLNGSQVLETIVRGEGDFLLPASETPANVIRVENGVEAQWAASGEAGYEVPAGGATLAEFVIELGGNADGAELDLGFSEFGLSTELLDKMGNLLPVLLKGGSVQVGESGLSVHGWSEQTAMVAGAASPVRVNGEESDLEPTWMSASGAALGPQLDQSGEYRLVVERDGTVVWESGATYVEVFEPGDYGLRLRPGQNALFAYLPEGGVWNVEHSSSLSGGWNAAVSLDVTAGTPVSTTLPEGSLEGTSGFFRVRR